MTDHAVKRRVLTKVRRQYLHKQPEEEAEEAQPNIVNLIATPEQLNQDEIRVLVPSIALVEDNRKICAGGHLYNTSFRVSNVVVERQPQSKAVILGLVLNDTGGLPWEYCVKRLESYGNLDLAIWAQRIKNYHESSPKLMSQYYEILNSEDPEVQAGFATARAKAIMICKQLESQYSYYKVTLFSTRTATAPISASYNEGMLKEMGHSIESFVDWTKENGLPIVFPGESPLHLEVSRRFLGNNLLKGELFQQGSDYITFLYDKEGNKRKVKIQLCLVKEPAENGFFRHAYVFLKNIDQEAGLINKSSEGGECKNESEKFPKQVKKEEEESINDSSETIDTGSHHDERSPFETDEL